MCKPIHCVLLVAVSCCWGCGKRSPDTRQFPSELELPAEIGERVQIEPFKSHLGLTGRSVLACPAGYCVILHYPPAPVEIEDLTAVLEGDPATQDDNGEVYYDPDSLWCAPSATGLARNTFNCCAFAVGDVAGLTADDWIRPIASGDTFFTNPMEVILESHYERVGMTDGSHIIWADIDRDDRIETGDVLCYVRTTDQYLCFTHVGKVLKKDGRNWLISKFGAGPILRATIEATAGNFAGQFDSIWIYRLTNRARS